MIFQYFRSIRVLFAVYFGIILLFIYLGFNFYQGDKSRELTERSKELHSIAKLKYSAVTQWYSERYSDAAFLFNNENLRNSLEKYLSSSSPKDSESIVSSISAIYENHDYSNLFILGNNYKTIIDLNSSGSTGFDSDSLKIAVKNGRVMNSDIYLDTHLQKLCMDIYIPAALSKNDTAVIVMKVDPERLLFHIISTWYVDNSSGESIFVTYRDDSINYISSLKFYSEPGKILKRPADDFNLAAAKAIAGNNGQVQGKDYRGEEVLADVWQIGNSPWYLITKMDLTEIYEPVTSSTLNNILILGLTIALGGIFLLYYYTKSNYNTLRQISETEKKFRSIFNNSTEAIVLIDKDKFIDCNPSAEKLYRLPRRKILGKTPGEFSPKYQPGNILSSEMALQLIESTLAGDPQKFEWVHSVDSNLIFTDISLSKMEIDGKEYVIGFLHDITERKLMEDAVYESEEKFRSIFNSAPVGIYQSTVAGDLIEVNAALVRLLGYDSTDDLQKANIAEDIYYNKEVRNSLIREFEPTGSVSDHEVQWKKKDGTIIWIQLNAFSVKDDRGNTKYFEGYVRDITSRRLAEEKLKESETKYRNLVENLNDIVYALDSEGKITFISSAVEKSTGYKTDELIGHSFTDYFHPDDVTPAMDNFQTLPVKKSIQSEYRIKTKSGEYRYVNSSSTVIFNDYGFIGVRGVLTDINEKRESEEKLKNQTLLLNETQHLARLGSWEHDLEKNYVFWSDEIYQILGVKKDELTNTPEAFYEFVHKEDLQAFLSAYDNSLTAGVDSFELEHRIVKKDTGRVRFVYQECRHTRDANGNIVRTIGMLQDITERVISGKHIQTLSKAIEQSPVSVVITDLQGSIQYVNNKFSEVTGYSLSEVINQNPKILKSGSQSREFYKVLWDTILSGNTWSGEIHNKKKNGELYWENAIISPIVNAEGRILNFVAVKEDITDKKKMYEDLITAKDKAEESNRLKSNFLANMSHELRTPMVGILGYTEILVSELSDPEHIELAKMVLSSGSRLIETLNSILDLSSIEAKKQDVKLAPVDIVEVLNESIYLFRPNAAAKGLYIKSYFQTESFTIHSDRAILAKIFNNLVNNAVKYTQSGGVIIEFSVTKNGDGKNIIVDVIDTGIGISGEHHEIVFEPFRQVSEGYTRKFEGTGLGLSITNKLVKLLNGNITLKSELGKGSIFTVKIPFINADNLPGQNTNMVPEAENFYPLELPENFTVLLVEDDESNAHLISAYLKPFCRVEHVPDGESAVNLCRTEKFDAVLMDINLKGINGIDAHEQIRRINDHYNTIPVIAVTALAMSGDKEKFLSLGFTQYLSKPFERSHLLSLLSSAVSKQIRR